MPRSFGKHSIEPIEVSKKKNVVPIIEVIDDLPNKIEQIKKNDIDAPIYDGFQPHYWIQIK